MKKPNFNPSPKELRVFGVVLLIGFGIIGALLFKNGKHEFAANMWKGASGVCLLSLLWPAAAKPLYRLWMLLGMAIGFVVSRVVLTVLFFGLITPLALVFRLRKRDELKLRKKEAATYWNDHPLIHDRKYYEHLF